MNSFISPLSDETSAQRAELARLVEGAVSGDGMHPTAIEPLHLITALRLNYGLPHGALALHGEQLVLVDTLMGALLVSGSIGPDGAAAFYVALGRPFW